eukprot:TRINITY_DN4980_c0_g1_i1.p2 TRINITY_DN4980_c0_g1~~TRINITY_DN4980_c0_g1_i1.p2  ORF type:complete len:247 (+),score=7.72 TRINITY_DN4980_c0_g1_i1:195-935(+)
MADCKLTAKIGDFGISKVLEHSGAFANTAVGTPFYMAPELFENRPYDGKSDVWAVGCISYECVALERPFVGKTYPALIARVVGGQCAPLPDRCSLDLRQIIGAMLEVDPSNRSSVDDLLSSAYFGPATGKGICPSPLRPPAVPSSRKTPEAKRAPPRVDRSRSPVRSPRSRETTAAPAAPRTRSVASLRPGDPLPLPLADRPSLLARRMPTGRTPRRPHARSRPHADVPRLPCGHLACLTLSPPSL